MNAAFFGLAFLAALNPKLLGVDVLLVENTGPRPMFLCFLLGGMGMSLAIGLLVIIPFVFLEIRPEGTKVRLERAQAWLMGHARELMAAVALVAGGYMVVSGLVRLLT